jgi:hypothetical protein
VKVDIFTLCQFANTERGSMNIIGSFHAINARQLPIIVPFCWLAIRMRFEKVDEGQKRIRISFIDADGKSVMPTLDAGISVRFAGDSPSAIVPFCIGTRPLNLPRLGEYSIDLAIDGRQEASTPLWVKQIQSPPPVPPQLPPEK